MWATVSGFCQTYHVTMDYALDMSWQNMGLYSSVLPSRESYKDKKSRRLNADDPRNRAAVERILGI